MKTFLLATALMATMAGNAWAAGSSSSGSTTPPKPTQTSETCKKTEVWDKKMKKCIEAEKSGFNDDELYDAGRELAYADRFEDAIGVLKVAQNQQDPRVLNYLGFANRKMGNVKIGMDYYRQALAINPDYVLARSYMGQAMLLEGDVAGAEAQLKEIRRRVGTQDYAYFSLAQSLKTKSAY